MVSFKYTRRYAAAIEEENSSNRAPAYLLALIPPAVSRRCANSRVIAEHRRVMRFQHLSIGQIHVHATWQTRIEAAYRAHNVNPLELVRAVFLEDRRVLYRIFVGTRCSVDVAGIRVPRRRWIRMVICNFTVAYHDVVRKHSAH